MLSEENKKLLIHLKELHDRGELVGQFTNIPDEVYHHPDCPGVSNSNLTTVSKSYDHYLASLEEARKEREETDFRDKFFLGRAYHMLTLEPERFYSTFAVCPKEPEGDKRTKVYKEALAEWEKTVLDPWEKENQGKVRIPQDLWDQLHNMTNATMAHPVAGPLIKASAREVTFFWKDEKTGITCKCRADAINFEYGIIIDLKSTVDASFLGFRKSVVKFHYDQQSAHYSEGISKNTKRKFQFLFMAQEKEGLFMNQLFHAPEPMIDVGTQMVRRALDKIKSVHTGQEASGYPRDLVTLDLPAYAYDISSR